MGSTETTNRGQLSQITDHFQRQSIQSPQPTQAQQQATNPCIVTGEDDTASEHRQPPATSSGQHAKIGNNKSVGQKLVEIPEDGTVLCHFYQTFNIKATKDGKDTFTAFERLKKQQAKIISLAERALSARISEIRCSKTGRIANTERRQATGRVIRATNQEEPSPWRPIVGQEELPCQEKTHGALDDSCL
jgi:hypothetical protein